VAFIFLVQDDALRRELFSLPTHSKKQNGVAPQPTKESAVADDLK
jgi:hypothetical protein